MVVSEQKPYWLDDVAGNIGLDSESKKNLERELKIFAAGKLYNQGKITSSEGAKIADVDRIDFLSSIGKYGFNAINITADQFKDELGIIKNLE